jgi:hypothetical protein
MSTTSESDEFVEQLESLYNENYPGKIMLFSNKQMRTYRLFRNSRQLTRFAAPFGRKSN